MHTREDWRCSSRRRLLTRGARNIFPAIARVVRALALAPPISMVVIRPGRLVCSIPSVRAERMADFA